MKRKLLHLAALSLALAMAFAFLPASFLSERIPSAIASEVPSVSISSLKFAKTSVTVHPGKTAQLTPRYAPSNATDTALLWTSSRPEVVQISQEGLVTAVAYGQSIITVRAPSGAKAICAVTVKNIRVSSVKLNRSSVTLRPNVTYQLTSAVSPSNAGITDLRWTSSNESVATVSETGLVTTLREGRATIRAYATDGSKKYASCTVTVAAQRVKTFRLDQKTVTLFPAQQQAFVTTIAPVDATYQTVVWTSSAPNVASVDNGTVTALAPGKAVITARTDNGRIKATATINVRDPRYTTLKISAVGDVMLGGDTRTGTAQRFDSYVEANGGIYSVFQNVKHVFHGDDLTIINLECVLTNANSYAGKPIIIRTVPANVAMLTDAGIEMCIMANNHSKDLGTQGYNETRNVLTGAGLAYTGFNTTSSMMINGLNVGFCGYQSNTTSIATVKKTVAAMKRKSDLVIVSFHFGDVPEFTYAVSSKQTSFARAAVDAGADLVLGHHPHYVSGIEIYKGKTIVYDLGNFVSTIRNPADKDSMIFQQTFRVYGDRIIETESIKVIPCSTTSVPEENNCQPVILTGADAQRVIDKINFYSAGLKVPANIQ